jgi:hypothetical protein
MKDFYNDFSFILGFMVLTLLVGMFAGEQSQKWFLLIVLLGMVLLNYQKFNQFLQEKFQLNE